MDDEFRFLKACRGEAVDTTPVWFMRQAGRYMREYRDMKEKHTFLEMCKTPELATEVTLQPLDALGVDAAILFADILLPLEPMGTGLEFSAGDGPVIPRPVREKKDVEKLRPVDAEEQLTYPTIGYTCDLYPDQIFRGDGFLCPIASNAAAVGAEQLREQISFFRAPEELGRILEELVIEVETDKVMH